jgi:hypothetical protein
MGAGARILAGERRTLTFAPAAINHHDSAGSIDAMLALRAVAIPGAWVLIREGQLARDGERAEQKQR